MQWDVTPNWLCVHVMTIFWFLNHVNFIGTVVIKVLYNCYSTVMYMYLYLLVLYNVYTAILAAFFLAVTT